MINIVFNKEITGYQNEEEFVSYLNGKKFGKVHPIFQDLIRAIYKYVDFQDIIYCWVNYNRKKADIYMKIRGYIRGISIKKGVKNSVHVESINDFITFLRENKVDEETISTVLKYHYADGSIDGKGKSRVSSEEFKKDFQKEIDKANKVLNNKELIENIISRTITKGNNSEIEINAIIYGVVDDFIWITKEEIYYILTKRLYEYSTSIHFSSLTYQNMSRNLNYNPKYESNRNKVQFKWYNISDDIIEVMATYRKKK